MNQPTLIEVTDPSASHNFAQVVIVKDVQMRFSSMVLFMVKWAFAAIPAMIILGFIWLFIFIAANALVNLSDKYLWR